MSVLKDSPAGDAESAQPPAEAFPITDYEELTVGQVIPRLDGLNYIQLRRVREHELRHGNRKPVLDAIERALG